MFNDLVKHAVDIQKLKNGIAQKTIKQFSEAYPTLKPFLLDISAMNQESIINQIMSRLDYSMGVLNTGVSGHLVDVALYESAFQAQLMSRFSVPGAFENKVISRQMAEVLVFDKHMMGELFVDSWKRIDDSLRREMAGQIRIAVSQGLTGDVIASQVKSKFISFSDDQLSSLTRTLIQNATNKAAAQTYADNDIKYLQICAIMDSRTTDICKKKNNEIIPADSTDIPPFHYNCRTFTIPVDSKDGIKTPKTYNDFYEAQDVKDGLSSTSKEKFETDQKIALSTLENRL